MGQRKQNRDLVQQVERDVVVRGLLALILTTAPLSIGAFIAAPEIVPLADVPGFERLLVSVVSPVIVGGMCVFVVRVRRTFRRTTRWLRERRVPDASERLDVTRLAWRLTLSVLPTWIAAMVTLVPATILLRLTNGFMVPLAFLGVTIAGSVTVAFAYVLIEDALRPLYAAALSDPQIGPERAVGLLTRFGVYWLVGSGLNLVATALVLIVLPDAGRRIALVFCAFGALVGGGLTILAARSVTARVERLLEDVQRVEEGDFATAADVDDLGEIGRLQRGFNKMVAGLRERERLSDLFGRHVGADVARRAVEGTGLAGDERIVTALFIDVIGSTTLATERPAAEVVELLNQLFDAVVRTVSVEGRPRESVSGRRGAVHLRSPSRRA